MTPTDTRATDAFFDESTAVAQTEASRAMLSTPVVPALTDVVTAAETFDVVERHNFETAIARALELDLHLVALVATLRAHAPWTNPQPKHPADRWGHAREETLMTHNDNVQTLVYTPNQNNVIDTTTYTYAMVWQEETAGVPDGPVLNVLHSLKLAYTTIADQRFE